MKITVAIDSFKGSLPSLTSGEAVKEAAERVFDKPEVFVRPLADGGEGTVDAIISANGGELITLFVTGPLGKPVKASYGLVRKTNTAVIEMSSAAGITLLKREELNPLYTTTFGVGEIIRDAISKGARRFIIGIGGSATNDGGVGMLKALGFEFFNSAGELIENGAIGLKDLTGISCDKALPELSECEFMVACDVKNPLCGEFGASAVYGPQKGATPEMIKDMDAWLKNYARLTKQKKPEADEAYEGTGAAGGMGFALMSYLGARLTSGIELIMRESALEEYIKKSDIVITGEGRLDGQSAMGKAPVGVARLAKKYSKLVIAFSGCVTEDAGRCNEEGIDAFFPILRAPVSLSEAMNVENAKKNLRDTAEQAFRLIKALTK